MHPEQLLKELAAALGIELALSNEGTCRIVFDEDDVDFEISGDRLFVIADVASAAGRTDAYGRLLAANHLGRETGGSVLSLDEGRETFVLHAVIEQGTPYPQFESSLTLFVKALRYWKDWLSALPESAGRIPEENTVGMLAV